MGQGPLQAAPHAAGPGTDPALPTPLGESQPSAAVGWPGDRAEWPSAGWESLWIDLGGEG